MRTKRRSAGDQVVRPGPGFRADHDRHAEGEDAAAEHQYGELDRRPRPADREDPEQPGKQVDDRPTAEHAHDRPELHIAPVDKQEDQNDQKTDGHVDGPVRRRQTARLQRQQAKPLDQDVEGVGAQVGQQKQRDAQMRDRESRKQKEQPQQDFFCVFLHFRLPAVCSFLCIPEGDRRIIIPIIPQKRRSGKGGRRDSASFVGLFFFPIIR